MKVALYSRPFPPAAGGMERFAEILANWLTRQGHDVTVITRSAGGDARLPYRVLRSPTAIEAVRALRHADVVHVNGLSVRGVLAARLARKRPVITHTAYQYVCPTGSAWIAGLSCGAGPSPGPCRGCREDGALGAARVAIHRGAAQLGVSVCVSRRLRERLGLRDASVIYNPCEVPAAAHAASATPAAIAFAGRLVEEKGVDLLLRAAQQLPEVQVRIAGSGPLRRNLEETARTLGLRDRVEFLEELPPRGVRDLYASAAVVCVPSLWEEPFGYAIAEAMALGRPVVATPVGASFELLADRRGFLADAVTPDALARALQRALADGTERAARGARAHAFALAQLSVDAIGVQYERVYERTVR